MVGDHDVHPGGARGSHLIDTRIRESRLTAQNAT